jgi:CRP-like cAMP-binding protein
MKLNKGVIFDVLQENDLIQGLSKEQAQKFYDRGKAVKAKPNTVIIHEGAPNNHLFLLLSGELEVFLPDSPERFSKVTMARRIPGNYVGEYSFMDSSPASASVKTVVKCILFQISHAAVEELFDCDPKIGQVMYRNLLLNLVGRLRESDHELDMIQPFT